MKKKEKEKAEQQQESSGSEDKRHHRLDSPLPTPQIPGFSVGQPCGHGRWSPICVVLHGDRARLQAGGSARGSWATTSSLQGTVSSWWLTSREESPGKAEAGKPEDGHTSAPDLAGRGAQGGTGKKAPDPGLLTWILRLEASFALLTTLIQESLLRKAGEAWAGGISDLCLWKQWQQEFLSFFSLPLKANVWGKKMQK